MADKEYIERGAVEKFIAKGLNNPDKSKAYGYDAVEILAEVHYMNAADVVEVRRGEWVLTVHKASVNYRWYVTASCSECKNEGKEIWSGFFPDFPDEVAEDIILHYAEKVKLKEMGNFCPNCGADMRGNNNENL